MVKDGVRHPFEQEVLVLCSFQFAARHNEELMVTRWDLVVIDEAHRLRNVYRPENKIGKALKGALSNAPKILLTAYADRLSQLRLISTNPAQRVEVGN